MAGVMKSLVDRLLEVPFVGFVYEGLEGVEDPSVCREAAARIAELEALVTELASDLESEIEYRYSGTRGHPALKLKYENDMSVVVRARAALKGRDK